MAGSDKPTALRARRGGGGLPHRSSRCAELFSGSARFMSSTARRPEDWVPGLKYVPLAKELLPFLLCSVCCFSAGRSKRSLRDLPKEAFLSFGAHWFFLVWRACFRPWWKGGAISKTVEFSKILVGVGVDPLRVITSFEAPAQNHFYPVGVGWRR